MLLNNVYSTNIPANGNRKWVPTRMKSSKVIPVKVKPTKVVNKKNSSTNCVKAQIYAELLFGTNRYYLIQNKIVYVIFSYIYSVMIATLILLNMYRSDTISVAHFVFKYTLSIEFFIIVTTSLVSRKDILNSFFRSLNEFDEKLNIRKDLKIVDTGYVCFFWVTGCFVYSLIEYILMYTFLYIFMDETIYSFYAMMLTHDYEQIMFFMLLRNIYLRLRILKAHVSKMFNTEEGNSYYRKKLDKVEALSNNARLDITSLHQVYDLLHKCADELNSSMSLPMTLILLTAGLSTTMLLKMMVTVIQTITTNNIFGKSTILYLLSRASKYTALVIVSCYYSSVTSTQVAAIRTMLHDAVHSLNLEKIERRKIKAFFQLTKENEFAYALGGVIRLNMSLPLSYMSLCTTYLVISIQFSKFFDN